MTLSLTDLLFGLLCREGSKINEMLHPSIGDIVIVKCVHPETPVLERVGTYVSCWSYIPNHDEVHMLALFDGRHIKWSNVTLLKVPAS